MAEDIELINNIKKNKDGKSLKELINRHSGIYVDMVNKYIPKSFNGVDKEDLLEEKVEEKVEKQKKVKFILNYLNIIYVFFVNQSIYNQLFQFVFLQNKHHLFHIVS